MRAARTAPALLAAVLAVGLAGSPAGAADGATLSGTVTGADGSPLAGVCVVVRQLASDGGLLEASTGADGTCVVEDVPAGDHVVGYNACSEPLSGFAPEWYDDQPRIDLATPVTAPAGGTVPGLDAVLEVTGAISGTVTDEDTDQPLDTVCVVAYGDETGTFVETLTDPEGAYSLADVPAGDYVILLGDCGSPYTHLGEVYDDVRFDMHNEPEPTLVTVVSGQATAGIDAALAQGGALEGTVTALHTGRPQSLVCVGLFPAAATDEDAGSLAGAALTGTTPFGPSAAAPGTYTIGGVPPGDYLVAFAPEQCSDDGYATTWAEGQATRDTATVLTVRKGEVATSVDGVVAPQPSISTACPFYGEPGGAAFSDVPPDNVHQRAVGCMAGYGVVTGRGGGSYAPAEPVSRAQLASFLARGLQAAGVELPAEPADAYDDDTGSVHERAIDQLAELGVLSGKGVRRFAPHDPVDRGQLATLLVGAYERATGFALRSSGDRFADDDGTTHEQSTDLAATAGLAAGVDSTRYAPAGLVRRDQAASALARLLDRAQRDLASAGVPEQWSTTGSSTGEAAAPRRADLRRSALDAVARLRD